MKNYIKLFLIIMILIPFTNCEIADTDVESEPNGSPLPSRLIQPGDLVYRGAFRLPDTGSGEITKSWEWGGYAMTFRPGTGSGTLFATGHAWEHQVSEISIPVPVISALKNPVELNTARTIQPFQDIYRVGDLEMPRVGIEYMTERGNQAKDKLYLCWGSHLEEGHKMTHGWCETTLPNPQKKGDWYIQSSHAEYNSNDYLFSIPAAWADQYTGGKCLATGRFRDGGWSGEGPALYAIGPWMDGNPPSDGQSLQHTVLLKYSSSADNTAGSHTMDQYHHSDEWSGAAWLSTADKWGVVFVGTKGTGDCWYGDSNGPCLDCAGERGWWSSGFIGQIIFYDPADLAEVAAGTKEPWEPQPYASLDIDLHLFHITSPQQWYHVGAATFDRQNAVLYIMEPLADGDKPLVHVWKIE